MLAVTFGMVIVTQEVMQLESSPTGTLAMNVHATQSLQHRHVCA